MYPVRSRVGDLPCLLGDVAYSHAAFVQGKGQRAELFSFRNRGEAYVERTAACDVSDTILMYLDTSNLALVPGEAPAEAALA